MCLCMCLWRSGKGMVWAVMCFKLSKLLVQEDSVRCSVLIEDVYEDTVWCHVSDMCVMSDMCLVVY